MTASREPGGATPPAPTPAPAPPSRPPISATIGTIVFGVTFMATTLVYIPYTLSGWKSNPPFLGEISRMAGVGLIVLGGIGILAFLVQFVREGHGTPAPFMPPKRLVVRGPFRYVRNPAYVCAVSLVAGQALYLGKLGVLFYAAFLALAFHLFVVFFEEPTLHARFGAEYEEYCRRVPRWIPRLPRPTAVVLLALGHLFAP